LPAGRPSPLAAWLKARLRQLRVRKPTFCATRDCRAPCRCRGHPEPLQLIPVRCDDWLARRVITSLERRIFNTGRCPNILCALFDYPHSCRRRIVVCDGHAGVPLWLAHGLRLRPTSCSASPRRGWSCGQHNAVPKLWSNPSTSRTAGTFGTDQVARCRTSFAKSLVLPQNRKGEAKVVPTISWRHICSSLLKGAAQNAPSISVTPISLWLTNSFSPRPISSRP
jgi:hypothetical protein